MAPKAIRTLAALGLLLSAGTAAAQLELVGTFGGGDPLEMQVQGDLAYCATTGGFLTLDVSDPAAPVQVSFLPMEYTTHVFFDDARAYVVRYDEELAVIDVSDPASPLELGSDFIAAVQHIYAAGDYAYLVCPEGLFLIYDVRDPSHMWEVGRMQYPGSLADFDVEGDYAYLGLGDYGLSILDIGDPSAPSEVARYDACPAQDVFVAGDLAYIAAKDSGVVVLDVSHPEAPERVGGLDLGWAWRIKVAGEKAYASVSDGVAILDLADPWAPVPASQVGWAFGDAYGEFLYVLGAGFGIKVVDAGDPYDPLEVGTYLSFGDLRAVRATPAGLVYLADGYDEFGVLDAGDPASPELMGREDIVSYCSDMRVVGSRVYLTTDTHLDIVDVTDPWNPESAGRLRISDLPLCVDVLGDYAYVGSYREDLLVIDVSDPAFMTEIGSVPTRDKPRDIRIAGDAAYVAERLAGLTVFDLSDPVSPSVKSKCDICGEPCSITALDISGDYAYIVDYWGWFVVVDIRASVCPMEIGRLRLLYHPVALTVAGCYAYVADESHRLIVVDVSDPEAPSRVETYRVTGWPIDVSTANGYVYLASRESALYVFKFIPSKLVVSGTVTWEGGEPACCLRVNLWGAPVPPARTDDKGYYEFRGLEAGTYTVEPTSAGRTFSPESRTVEVIDRDVDGVDFTGLIPTHVTITAGSHGYASRGGTVYIGISTPGAGDVRVAVYTMEGELVWETIVDVLAGTGGEVAPWHCVNTAGQPVASGVYLIRVTGAGLDELKKAVVVN